MQTYSLTLEEYEAMRVAQGGLCAICCEEETMLDRRTGNVRRLSVDHCHSTGKVRGLLCHACNIAIGKMQESPAVLRSAAMYLEKHQPSAMVRGSSRS